MKNDMHPRTSRWTTVIGILVAIISLALCAAGGYLAWKKTADKKKETSTTASSAPPKQSTVDRAAAKLISTFLRVPTSESISFEGKPLPAGPTAQTQQKHEQDRQAWQLRKITESWRKAHPDKAAGSNAERFMADAWGWLNHNEGTTQSAAIITRARELPEADRRDPILGMMRALVLWDEQATTVTLQAMRDAEKGLHGTKGSLVPLYFNHYYQASLLTTLKNKPETTANIIAGFEALAQAMEAGEFAADEGAFVYGLIYDLNEYSRSIATWSRIQSIFQAKKKIDPWLLDIITAQSEIERGWAARGGGWASTVSQEGWRSFELHLGQARAALIDAWKRHPEWPQAATMMIKVTMGGCGEPGVSARDWFDRAVAARLDFKYAYTMLLQAMLPRWGGSHEAMVKFARECLNTGRFDTRVPYYYLQTLREIGEDCTQGAWRSAFRRPGIADDLDRMFQSYLKDPNWATDRPSLLAQRAVVQAWCGNYTRAQELMKAVPAGVQFQWWLVGQPISWGAADRKVVEAELRAFTGPQKETLTRAEALHYSGKVSEAVELYTKAMEASTADSGVRAYLANRIGNIIMDDGEHYTETNGYGWTTLHRALLDRHDDLARFLIENGVDLSAVDSDGRTPLGLAMAQDQVPLMKLMLEHGANPNQDPDKQTTPLNAAIMRNRPDIVEMLIAKGANLNQISHGKWAPILQAIATNNTPMLKLLLDHGADPNLRIGQKMPPLIRTCDDRQVDMARMLIAKGANPNGDYLGFTPLHYCADRALPEIAQLLIQKGARLDTKASDGSTPLDQARHKKDQAMIKLLEEAGKKKK